MEITYHQKMLNAMQSQVALLDDQGVIVFVNDAWLRFAEENGMPSDFKAVGANYLYACEAAGDVQPKDAKTVYEGIEALLEGRSEDFFYNYPCHAPDQQRWFQLRITRFIADERVWLTVVHENVTELERMRKYQSQMFHMMGHDLKLPLSTFLGYASIFQNQAEQPSPEDVLEIIEQYRKASVHMMNIVQNMLGMGQAEHGKLETIRRPCSFAKTVSEATGILHPLYDGKDFTLSVSVPEVEVLIDVNKIRQVLINLIGNAIKFTRVGGIRIYGEIKGDFLHCMVKDTGKGMPEDRCEAIFHIYEHALEGDIHNGTGLGLSISRKIIELHGGTLTATSQPGKGSTFTFTLPL